jgi:phage gp36-like protein
MFLDKSFLKTHVYAEIIDEITRQDDEIVEKGIKAAIGEAKSYLSRFDKLAIFGTDTVTPTVSDDDLAYLREIVIEIAVWKIVRLSNPNVELKLMRTGYEDAINWLKMVQKGQVDPSLPYKADDATTETFNENSSVQFSSNTKRNNHF